MKHCIPLLLVLLACNSPADETDAGLAKLADYMQGSFSSAAQAAADSNYFDISLHMYPIWQTKYPGQHWLYVEQAMTTLQDRPYRQRIYQLVADGDSVYRSLVYTLPSEAAFVGKWREPAAFDTLSAESLTLREGCEVYLVQVADTLFTGNTQRGTCESNLRGAAYATSEVRITPGRIESWDQGFDSTGVQVWGATGGGYVFVK
ncbi:MAG: chromophore lyase CpcT/CpeT [Bacteroidia bacterium]